MSRSQGKPFTPEEKKFIVLLKKYFDRNRPQSGPKDSSVQMTADALRIGLASVNRIVASYQKNPDNLNALPKNRGRPEYVVSDSYQEIVRAYIRAANAAGRYITLEAIANHLKEQAPHAEEFDDRTLSRALDRWGFEFGKGVRTQHLKEKDYVVVARRRYLRKMIQNRASNGETVRPEVYLDESYVNKNHSNDWIWYSREDGPLVQKPTGNGERFIIMNAITKQGWVPGAKIIFKSTKKTGDYHGQMNGEIFQKWFSEKLIPNIPKTSIIIMDNAAYHNILSIHSAPTAACSKGRIVEWLAHNKFPCSADCLKVELVETLLKYAPEPTCVVDEIARQAGHEIYRTPPYHPELQPIEVCWGILKNEIARNCNFTMKNLELQLDTAFAKVTEEICAKIIQKVKRQEDAYWEEDAKMDENTELAFREKSQLVETK
jgi:transposase